MPLAVWFLIVCSAAAVGLAGYSLVRVGLAAAAVNRHAELLAATQVVDPARFRRAVERLADDAQQAGVLAQRAQAALASIESSLRPLRLVLRLVMR